MKTTRPAKKKRAAPPKNKPSVQAAVKGRKLTERLREELHQPIGQVYSEKDALELLKKKKTKLLIAVGDTCGYMLLKNGVKPQVFVFDYKNLRVPVSPEVRKEIERHARKKKKVSSEAGFISRAMEKAVAEAVKKRAGNIFVEGEEDLAALVALANAPDGSVIVYGQPREGVVLVFPTEKEREKAKAWLEECEKV